jgi:iron complex outermembrane recepter protein
VRNIKIKPNRFFLSPVGAAISISFGLVLCMPSKSNAQNAKEAELPDVVITDRSPDRNYVVEESSIGTKLDIPLQELPQSAQIITSAVIHDQGITSLQEVMKTIGGSSPSTTNPPSASYWTNYNIRGFAVSPLTDGLPTTYGAASRATDLLINIDRVDVLKGPAAVAYGASQDGSLGGVINLVTKQPLSTPRQEFNVSLDRFGSISPSFDLTGPLNEEKTILFRLTGQENRDKSFINSNNQNSFGVFPTLKFTDLHGTSLTLQAEYTERKTAYYPGLPYPTEFSLPTNANYGEPSISRPTTSYSTQRATFEHEINDDWTAQIIVLKFKGVEAYAGSDLLDFQGNTSVVNRQALNYREVDEDTSYDVRLHGKVNFLGLENKLLFGFQRQNYLGMTDTSYALLDPIDILNPIYGATPTGWTPTGPTYVDHSTYSGIYFQDQVKLTSALKVLFGLRYSIIKDNIYDPGGNDVNQTLNALSPSIGATYALTNNVSLFAGYNQGISPALGHYLPGTQVLPERSRQTELGLKFALAHDLSASFAVFNLEHYNASIPAPSDPVNYVIQTGLERSRGFEADLTGAVTHNMQVQAYYAFTDARVIVSGYDSIPSGTPFINTPLQSSRVFAVYNFNGNESKTGLRIGGGLTYVGEREATIPSTFKLPAYSTLDAMVGYKFDRQTELTMSFQNLTNRTYYVTGSGGAWDFFNGNSSTSVVVPGTPFNAVLNLRTVF